MREVDPATVDAARGMGMSGPQVLAKVELPLATPLLIDGVRLAAVQVVATATIAALVAGGGLGTLITEGFALQDQAQVVAGALCVLVLALTVEGADGPAAAPGEPVAVRAQPLTDRVRPCDRVRTVMRRRDARRRRQRLGRYSG